MSGTHIELFSHVELFLSWFSALALAFAVVVDVCATTRRQQQRNQAQEPKTTTKDRREERRREEDVSTATLHFILRREDNFVA